MCGGSLRFQFGRCSVRSFFEPALEILRTNQELFEGFMEHMVPWGQAEEVGCAYVAGQEALTRCERSTTSCLSGIRWGRRRLWLPRDHEGVGVVFLQFFGRYPWKLRQSQVWNAAPLSTGGGGSPHTRMKVVRYGLS